MSKIRFNLLFIISFFTVFSICSQAQDITAKAYTDKQQYYIGDFITYTLDVTYGKGIKIFTPAIKDSLNQFEIINTTTPRIKVENGKKTISYSFTIARYDSANILISSIPIYYAEGKDTVKVDSLPFNGFLSKEGVFKNTLTNQVLVKINGIKISKEEETLKDIKGPNELPPDYLFWAIVILVSAGAIFAAYYFISRYFKKRKENMLRNKPVIAVPPYKIALTKLNELEQKQLWQNGFIKEYHSSITEIIRKYFEDQFKLPALELTTSEIVDLLDKNGLFGKIKDLTFSFLSNADMVKFAKFVPLNNVNEEMMHQAKEIINTTKTVLETPDDINAA
ncbi:MAG: hypothetical protein Q8903_06670 [Bacteroidota bacterium]|nr:hypothetical protein [Bacteroidota bacterium]